MELIENLRIKAVDSAPLAWALSRLLGELDDEDSRQEALIWRIIAATGGEEEAAAELHASNLGYTIGVEEPRVLAAMLADARRRHAGGGFLVSNVLLKSSDNSPNKPIPDAAAAAARYWLWRDHSSGFLSAIDLAELLRDGRGGSVDMEKAYGLFAIAAGDYVDLDNGELSETKFIRQIIEGLAGTGSTLSAERLEAARAWATKLSADHQLPPPLFSVFRKTEGQISPTAAHVEPTKVVTKAPASLSGQASPVPAKTEEKPEASSYQAHMISAFVAVVSGLMALPLFTDYIDSVRLRGKSAGMLRLLQSVFGYEAMPAVLSVISAVFVYFLTVELLHRLKIRP